MSERKVISSYDELFRHMKSSVELWVPESNTVNPYIKNITVDFDFHLPIVFARIVDFLNKKNYNAFFFENVYFKKTIFFSNISTGLNFEKCEFGKIEADNSTFESKVRFRRCVFNESLLFNNTKFKDLADFWNSIFTKSVIFYKVDFEGTVVFSSASFFYNVLFTYSLFLKQVIFRDIRIIRGIDLSTAIIEGNLSLFEFNLKDYKSIEKELTKEEYEENISEIGEIPINNKRETFRIIKRVFEQNSDFIHSLDYKKLELKTYNVILTNKIWRRENFWMSLLDKFILFSNKISNNYGTNFLFGVLFTLFIGLFFYFLTFINSCTINTSGFNLNYFWSNYFIYLNPAHSPDFLGEKNNAFYYFFDYCGRIFIGYGIYQTIQAFRKYK